MKFIVTALAVLVLAGCDFELYRYPCQDPDNWNKAECQKPLCEVSRTCPEHIFKNDSVIKSIPQPVTTTPNKGGCK